MFFKAKKNEEFPFNLITLGEFVLPLKNSKIRLQFFVCSSGYIPEQESAKHQPKRSLILSLQKHFLTTFINNGKNLCFFYIFTAFLTICSISWPNKLLRLDQQAGRLYKSKKSRGLIKDQASMSLKTAILQVKCLLNHN